MDKPEFNVIEAGREIVTIGADGKITLAPHMTVDAAARAFWDAVMVMNPYRKAIEEERERCARVAEDAWNMESETCNMKAHGAGIAKAIRSRD